VVKLPNLSSEHVHLACQENNTFSVFHNQLSGREGPLAQIRLDVKARNEAERTGANISRHVGIDRPRACHRHQSTMTRYAPLLRLTRVD
jgi:hypothetical protein